MTKTPEPISNDLFRASAFQFESNTCTVVWLTGSGEWRMSDDVAIVMLLLDTVFSRLWI